MPRKKTKDQNQQESSAIDPFEAEDNKPGSKGAGQAGDTQGLSDVAQADSQSVEELVEEGQFFEAEVIGGVENAPPADLAEVTTREVPEDDVPPEYLESEQDVDPA
jgi:hypothetical protein